MSSVYPQELPGSLPHLDGRPGHEDAGLYLGGVRQERCGLRRHRREILEGDGGGGRRIVKKDPGLDQEDGVENRALPPRPFLRAQGQIDTLARRYRFLTV